MTELDPSVKVDAVCAYTKKKVRARYLAKDKQIPEIGADAVATYPDGVITLLGQLYEGDDGGWEFMAERMLEQHSAMGRGISYEAEEIWRTYRTRCEEELEFGARDVWDRLPEFTRDHLVEARLCGLLLPEGASTDRMVVLTFSNCLEIYLLERIFRPFCDSSFSESLPKGSYKNKKAKNQMKLNLFVQGSDDQLSLGNMGHILKSLGVESGSEEDDGFSLFLGELLTSHEEFFEEQEIPDRLISFAKKYRNPAVHPTRRDQPSWGGAWGVVIDGPKSLLVAIESLIRLPDEDDSEQ